MKAMGSMRRLLALALVLAGCDEGDSMRASASGEDLSCSCIEDDEDRNAALDEMLLVCHSELTDERDYCRCEELKQYCVCNFDYTGKYCKGPDACDVEKRDAACADVSAWAECTSCSREREKCGSPAIECMAYPRSP